MLRGIKQDGNKKESIERDKNSLKEEFRSVKLQEKLRNESVRICPIIVMERTEKISRFKIDRIHLFEFEDQKSCPKFIRDSITNCLHILTSQYNMYSPIFPKIAEVLEKSGTNMIFDLCSGSGGPLENLRQFLDRGGKENISIVMSDYYPNIHQFNKFELFYKGRLKGIKDSIDATNVPKDIRGMRTIFTSFHHFSPKQALKILQDAVEHEAPIGVFEFSERNLCSVYKIFSVPLFWFCSLPSIRPLNLKVLIFTYLLPIIPFVITWDAIISDMRAYSFHELANLIKLVNNAEKYKWEIGRNRNITYFVGYPIFPKQRSLVENNSHSNVAGSMELTKKQEPKIPSKLRHLSQTILNWSYTLYVNSPINFSSITGWRYPGIPRLKGNPIMGKFPKFLKEGGAWNNFLEAGARALNHSTGMCYYWVLNRCILVITKPEDIKNLLITNAKKVIRTSFRGFESQFGTSILSDPHEIWKQKKPIYLNFLYNSHALMQYESQMWKNIGEFLMVFKGDVTRVINLTDLIVDFTINNLASNIVTQCQLSPENRVALSEYLRWINDNVFNAKNSVKTRKGIMELIRMLALSKEELTSKKEKLKNMLKRTLLKPEIYENRGFVHDIYSLRRSEDDVLGDINVLFFAGTDTTASTFQFIIKLLIATPRVLDKLYDELHKNLKDKDITIENINGVQYLDMVISESLRMYPPIPFLAREVESPFKLGGVNVSRKEIVIYTPYFTHRRSELFEKPNEFIPERFENRKISAYTFIPFGAGSQECVGMRFARQTLKMLLTAIFLQYRVKLENNNFEIGLKFGGVAHPKEPILATFTPLRDSVFSHSFSRCFTSEKRKPASSAGMETVLRSV